MKLEEDSEFKRVFRGKSKRPIGWLMSTRSTRPALQMPLLAPPSADRSWSRKLSPRLDERCGAARSTGWGRHRAVAARPTSTGTPTAAGQDRSGHGRRSEGRKSPGPRAAASVSTASPCGTAPSGTAASARHGPQVRDLGLASAFNCLAGVT